MRTILDKSKKKGGDIMGTILRDDIMGYAFKDHIVCTNCATDDDEKDLKENEILKRLTENGLFVLQGKGRRTYCFGKV